jgi:DNA-binding MarR family transcriptional regulator
MSDPSNTSIDTANQLHRSVLRLFRLLRDMLTTRKLSLSKVSVLGCLYREAMATATELAVYLRVKPQSLTRLLADLERSKLITRRPNEADRRQSLLEITDKGIQLLTEEVRDQRLTLAKIIARELTPAEQELLRLAAGLMDHVASACEAQAAPPSSSRSETKRRRVEI